MLSFHRDTRNEYHGGGGIFTPTKTISKLKNDRAPWQRVGAPLRPFCDRDFLRFKKWRNP